MTSQLDVLVGLVVTDALKVHDYVQLLFEKDISLNLYNAWRLFNGDDLRSLNGVTFLPTSAGSGTGTLVLKSTDSANATKNITLPWTAR